ncbi:MAG TPA: hypothetical protein VJS38_07885 [Phenylobacterium sp.]|uniref:hypothetical protein n=1 Tax=Phenylobacterium sp. TaxID=1871053 RepID=UPI002B478FF3|nr:hypothetical protein [Phenylobacterium sp.]HKR88082.1 hypothetical protein [Phenylobacterium sp.]
MPWVSRPAKRSRGRLRTGLRRWRYDHSQGVIAFWIGAVVVAVAVVIIAMMRAMLR